MKHLDFLRIVGAEKEKEVEYAPVAGMLDSAYGFVGYFNSHVNEGLEDTCVLLNARLIDLREVDSGTEARPRIRDFNEFLEDIVLADYSARQSQEATPKDAYGQSIPLAAIPLDKIAALYPVGHITSMMQRLHEEEGTREGKKLPRFLDFDDRSVVLKILRTRLW